jgi:CheY-like chemotaxis protein/HPt (histidine-containing phosphotransfer) domain-containing protein
MIPLVPGNKDNVQFKKELKKEQYFYAPDANILVVDDNEFNLKVAVGLLGLYKIDAKTASSGKEALEMIQQNDYDIVFMDHMMPEMDGIEMTLEIKKLGGKYAQLIIIALTANAVRGAMEIFFENGFKDLVTKPIDSRELNRVLEKWLPPKKIKRRPKSEALDKEIQTEESMEIGRILDALGKIAEINTGTGLQYVSGMKDIYCKTVELFYEKLLSECEKMSAFVDNSDITNFAITVHSMKSMLASIGAAKLSVSAFELETAAKNNDLTFCTENFPKLKEKLLLLNEQLSVIFPKKEDNSAKEPGDIALLKENVEKTLTAAEEFDNDTGIEAIGVLLSYDFGAETNALLKSAMTALKNFDFDTVVENLKGII